MKSPPEPESTNALAEMSLFPTRSITDKMSLESVVEDPVKVIAETPTVSTVETEAEGSTGGGGANSVIRGSEGERFEKSTPGRL